MQDVLVTGQKPNLVALATNAFVREAIPSTHLLSTSLSDTYLLDSPCFLSTLHAMQAWHLSPPPIY